MALELQIVSPTSTRDNTYQPTISTITPGPQVNYPPDFRRTSGSDGTEASVRQNTTFLRSSSIITSVAGVTVLNTFGQSLLIVAIPQIARDLNMPSGQLFWPTAVGSLTLGCLLLVVGKPFVCQEASLLVDIRGR